MTEITEKQLIKSLGQLKEIKPRKEWAVLLKSQILAEQKEVVIKAQSVSFMDVMSAIFAPKKLAYSFTVVFFLIVGVFGFARYTLPGDLLFPIKKIAESSQAVLTGQTGLKNDVATLNSRINDLAAVAKNGKADNIPSAINEIKANASELARNLKNNSANDPETLKEIVSSLKTLADVPGTDLSENSDVKGLYEAVAYNQIIDLEKITSTLTEDQRKVLVQAENLYNDGKYSEALEKVLLINK